MVPVQNNESFITVTIKDVYGKPVAYPMDKGARTFASIAGTKTLTQTTLIQVLSLLFAIVVLDRYGNVSAVFRATDLHSMCKAVTV
jgi:hypothetical protein